MATKKSPVVETKTIEPEPEVQVKSGARSAETTQDTSQEPKKGLDLRNNSLAREIASKQPMLVSGTNIKTINGQSLLGSGNLAVDGHFKGWWPDLATLKAAHTATEGDSAYVKDASPATTWSIYVYDSTASSDNYWADSGTDADTSNVQTFQTGEEVNEIGIDSTHLMNPSDTLAISEDVLKLSMEDYEKITVDLTDFGDGLPYNLNNTGNYGTNNASSHICFYVEDGDVIEAQGNADYVNRIFMMSNADCVSGSTVQVVDGTTFVTLPANEKIIAKVPKGTKCIGFNYRSSSASYLPQSLVIWRKKKELASFTRTIPTSEYISYQNIKIDGSTEEIYYYGASYNMYVIPLHKGCDYVFDATWTSGHFLGINSRLPLVGDVVEVTAVPNHTERQIHFSYHANDDVFLVIGKSSINTGLFSITESYTANDDLTDARVQALLSKSTFEMLNTAVKSGGIFLPSNGKSGLFTTLSDYSHQFVNVEEGDLFCIKKGTYRTYYAWLQDTLPTTNYIKPNYVSGYGLQRVQKDTEYIIVPQGAKYLYIYVGYTNTNYQPSYIGRLTAADNPLVDDMQSRREFNQAQSDTIGLMPLNVQVDSEGWELPTTLQQLNALKKAEQLCNITWTPKYDVPSKKGTGNIYPANTEVTTGIPYSSNNDDGSKTVGEEVSLHTFMTAVNNPFSLLYTECVCNGNGAVVMAQKSGWRKVYTLSSNGYAYYGTVCCGLTSSVENSPLKWNNNVIRNYTRTNGLYVPISQMGQVDFNLLKVGDICDNTAHSFMIYGLRRDTNGNVDRVKIVESSSGIGRGGCRVSAAKTRSGFLELINGNNPYTIYRYMKLWDNTDYEPSPYVPLTERGEEAQTVAYNDAICTFAGDEVSFRVGDLVVVNYNLNGTQPHDWTKIKVYKDDVLLNEYTLDEAEATLTEFYTANGDTSQNGFNIINQHNHALVLGTELSAGVYKACMSDGTNDSDFTKWEVIANDITVVEQGYDTYKVSVSGGFLEAIYIVGNSSTYYLPTYDEQTKNEFIIHPIAMMNLWGYSYDGIKVKVKLRGKYGSVTTNGATVIEGSITPEPEPDDDDNNP